MKICSKKLLRTLADRLGLGVEFYPTTTTNQPKTRIMTKDCVTWILSIDRHTGQGMGIPPTNKKVTIHGITISHRNAEGKGGRMGKVQYPRRHATTRHHVRP
jgi:hypothetical protein